jgi:hypothetical protein
MNKFYTYVKSLVLSLLLIGSIAVQAQNYVRSTFNAPYVPISIAGGATASTATGDGVLQTLIPIGFTFNFYGVPYTTIAVSTDGFASFTATVNSLTNTNLYVNTAPNAVIAPWWDDLTTSQILYQTTGTPGSQIFTIQWTSLSYWTGSTRTINYQVKLYEGTDIIEMHYDQNPIVGTVNAAESASIGICNQTGGPGNYIDAITGSSVVNNSMMNSLKWPKLNFRFTPGSPTPVSAGLINVGIGQTYNTLWEAVADINHRSTTGTVILNLTDALYDSSAAGGYNMFPVVVGPTASNATNALILNGNNATLAWYGSLSGNIGNTATTLALSNTSEPIIAIVGADNMVITSTNFNGNFPTSANRVDRAVSIINLNATDGAQNNTITNVNITLDRTNTSSIGIQINAVTAPTAATGANSNNTIRNFNIENSYAGISLLGNATFPDVNNQITSTVCTNYNQIGNPLTANDIGNGATATYGIQLSNQSDFTVSNNRISNVTNTGGQADGINILAFQGNLNNINNNIIRGIRNAGAASTTVIAGIRATHAITGTHTLRIFNNSISDITSGYTGAASATRVIRGINIAGTGGAATQAYEIYNNSVSIDGSASLNISSVCLEIATATGPIYRIANNNFANFTAAQTGVARHYIYRSTSATSFGPTGTILNNNNLFILNDVGTTGFIGQGNTTDYATLANWQTAMTQDAASISTNPNFVDNYNNLRATNLALNGAGQTPPAYLTQDLDCAARTPDNDIGAYIINACTGTPTAGTISGPNAVCSGLGATLTLNGASTDGGITYQWAVSPTSGGPYTNLGTGGTQVTGPLTADAYYIVTVTCGPSGLSATTAEKLVAVNPLPNVTASPATANYCTGAPAIALTASGADTYTWSPATGLSATTGATVNATPNSTITYTVSGTDANGCVNTATSTINVNTTPYILSVSATPSNLCSGDNSQLDVSGGIYTATTVNNYLFSNNTGANLFTLTSPTQAVGSNNDDTPSAVQNIGFTFRFEGNAYTQFSVSPDGWIRLGGGAASNEFTNSVISTTNIPKIYPYWDDLATGTNGNVRYQVTGTAPNRILVVEWFVTIPRNTIGPANSTFQAWLYETSGRIEFRYGTMGTGTMSASVGATGASLAPVHYQSITISSNTSSNSTPNNNNTGQPALGTLYTLMPPNTTPSYTWSPATFLSATNIANPVAQNVTATTTYTVVADNNGCTTTDSVTVNVTPLTLSFGATPNDTICQGSNITIQSIPLGGGQPYTYSWTGPNNFTSSVQNPALTNAQPNASGFYVLELTDNCGTTLIDSIQITVHANPIVTVTPDTAQYCNPGTPVALTASGADTYTWSPAAGLSATTGASVNASPTANTNYIVVGTDLNGCIGRDTAVINVVLSPVIASVTATPSTICQGDTAQLDVVMASGSYCVPTVGFPGDTDDYIDGVQFSNLSNLNSGDALSDFTYYSALTANVVADGTTPYTLTLTPSTAFSQQFRVWIDFNQDGIFDASESIFATTTATTSPVTTTVTIPSTALNGITRMRVACRFSTAILATEACGHTGFGEYEDYNVSITGGTPSTLTYAWTPAVSLSNASINNPLATPNVTETYTVTVTNGAGCPATQTVTVNVNPAPIVDLGADTLICGGSSFTLDAGNAGADYLWNDNSTNQTLLATASGVYTVTVTELVNNCSATDSIAVTFGTVPTVTLPNDTAICAGSSLTINAGAGFASYDWSTGANTQTITVTTANTYTVTVTNNDGCEATDNIVVAVNPLPIVSLGNDTTICNNQNLVLNAGAGFASYTWTPSGNTQTITATGANTVNTYTVTVVDNNGCSNTDAITVTFSTCAGDKEEEMNNYISLYPNPNNGTFFVDVISQSNIVEFNLVDLTGKVIYSEIVNSGNITRKQLDLQAQPAGIYLLVIKSDNMTKTLRISKY